jgi:hypothetical protein
VRYIIVHNYRGLQYRNTDASQKSWSVLDQHTGQILASAICYHIGCELAKSAMQQIADALEAVWEPEEISRAAGVGI